MASDGSIDASYQKIKSLLESFDDGITLNLEEYGDELSDLYSRREIDQRFKRKPASSSTQAQPVLTRNLTKETQGSEDLSKVLEGMVVENDEHEFSVDVTPISEEDLQRNLIVFESIVSKAKRGDSIRAQKLGDSLKLLKEHQQEIVFRSIDSFKKQHAFHRIKKRLIELDNQLTKQRALINEKNYVLQVKKSESNVSAEELRKKFEQETELQVRNLLESIEKKKSEVDSLTKKSGEIKIETERILREISIILHELEKEEKAKVQNPQKIATYAAVPSELLGILDAFPFLSADLELTDDMIEQAIKCVEAAELRLNGVKSLVNLAQDEVESKKHMMSNILKSEDSKALERLKKMVSGLEQKVASDEKRMELLENLTRSLKREHSSSLASSSKTANNKYARNSSAQDSAMMKRTPSIDGRKSSSISRSNNNGDQSSIQENNGQTTLEEAADQAKYLKAKKTKYTSLRDKYTFSKEEPISSRIIAAHQVSKIHGIVHMFHEFNHPPAYLHTALNVIIPPLQSVKTTSTATTTTGAPTSSVPSQTSAPSTTNKATTPTLDVKPRMSILSNPNNQVNSLSSPLEAERKITPTNTTRSHSPAPPSRDVANSSVEVKEEPSILDKMVDLEENEAYFVQNYGYNKVVEQLNTIMTMLADWNITSTDQDMKNLKLRSEEEELETVEVMRHEINKALEKLKNAYRQGSAAKRSAKEVAEEFKEETKKCDRLRIQLLSEIEGLQWSSSTQPGQYQTEVVMCKGRIGDLRKQLKDLEDKIARRRMTNLRLSQLLSSGTTSHHPKAGYAFLDSPSHSHAHTPITSNTQKPFSKYSVANDRMAIFNDMSNIYDNAIRELKSNTTNSTQ